ncbi:uncharacterized protein [Penaeus vannamei]|uniref:uncharacterized protein isoform X2 n=1 Tax=Penaeus vannamei TaxID=6689 RepID=UPI00387F58B7
MDTLRVGVGGAPKLRSSSFKHNIRMDHFQHLQHLVALQRGASVERYVVRDRMNPFQSYSNEEFVARYRVTKECVTELLETIRHRLAVVHNNRDVSQLLQLE